jgi:hypothetical protein
VSRSSAVNAIAAVCAGNCDHSSGGERLAPSQVKRAAIAAPGLRAVLVKRIVPPVVAAVGAPPPQPAIAAEPAPASATNVATRARRERDVHERDGEITAATIASHL